MKRKLLSLLLVLAMVLAVFPVSALAADEQTAMTQDGLLFKWTDIQHTSVTVMGFDPNGTHDTDLVIPEAISVESKSISVAAIALAAFKNSDITSVYIPGSVESVRRGAFEGCKKLADVVFAGDRAELGKDCFKNCTSLTEIQVPDTVSGDLLSGTFEGCTGLVAVTLEYGIQSIKEGAFKGCTALEYISLPASIEQIYTKDFEEMEGVTVSAIPGTEKDSTIAQQFASNMGFTFVAEDYSNEETLFSDIKGNKYYFVPVLWGYTTGVVAGYVNGGFGPGDKCTRAQMITFLWRMNGCPSATSSHDFCDVPSGEYYAKAVQWAYAAGITAGTGLNKSGKDTFSPNAPVTREQVIALLWRMDGRPKAVATTTPFTDVSSKTYYYSALLWASETKVVAGTTATTFEPSKSCTRAQIISFMYRNLHHLNRHKDSLGKFI